MSRRVRKANMSVIDEEDEDDDDDFEHREYEVFSASTSTTAVPLSNSSNNNNNNNNNNDDQPRHRRPSSTAADEADNREMWNRSLREDEIDRKRKRKTILCCSSVEAEPHQVDVCPRSWFNCCCVKPKWSSCGWKVIFVVCCLPLCYPCYLTRRCRRRTKCAADVADSEPDVISKPIWLQNAASCTVQNPDNDDLRRQSVPNNDCDQHHM